MTHKPPPLPDEFLNEMEGLISSKSVYQFAVGDKFLEGWEELGEGYTNYFKSERKAHRWFLESVAASSGESPSTLRHHYRVSKHVTQRIRNKHQGYHYSHWRAMLAGDGDPEENLWENLEWANEQFDKHGHPPSTRDIEAHVKKNGDNPVWANRLERLVGILQAMADDDGAPNWLRDLCHAALKEIAKRSE